MKRSAGLDCVSVSSVGSVVTSWVREFQSFEDGVNARTHSGHEWLRQSCRFLCAQVDLGDQVDVIHTDDILPCCQLLWLALQASRSGSVRQTVGLEVAVRVVLFELGHPEVRSLLHVGDKVWCGARTLPAHAA